MTNRYEANQITANMAINAAIQPNISDIKAIIDHHRNHASTMGDIKPIIDLKEASPEAARTGVRSPEKAPSQPLAAPLAARPSRLGVVDAITWLQLKTLDRVLL